MIYFGTLDDKTIVPHAFYVHELKNEWKSFSDSLIGAENSEISFSTSFYIFGDSMILFKIIKPKY